MDVLVIIIYLVFIKYNMVKIENIYKGSCISCGAKMGCNCQLVNGLCPGCYAASLAILKPK